MPALDLASRAASALLPRVWSRVPADDRTLYLTFDDGPSEATRGVLAVLAAADARASFFVQGARIAAHAELLRAMRAGGHAVGSHGWDHRDPWRGGTRASWHRADEALAAACGAPVRWVRPPYGHLTPALLRHARRHDQAVALWDVMPGDFRPDATPQRINERVRRHARPGAIVVLHDGEAMRARAAALAEQLVPALVADGWHLHALPDHPGSPGGSG